MARRRTQSSTPGRFDHVMARGNARRDIVLDDGDRQQWTNVLERTVVARRWELFAFVLMSNHFHLLLRTPEANLSRGMHRMLSGFATWRVRCHRHSGHLFQGRFRAQLIEDESYFWTVSRYLHLNPVRAKLVNHPRDWIGRATGATTPRGGVWTGSRMIRCSRHYKPSTAAWTLPVAYRRYVTAGLSEPLVSPFSSVWQGRVIGSEEFIAQVKRRLTGVEFGDRSNLAETTGGFTPPDDLQSRAELL